MRKYKHTNISQLENIMSKFLDDFRAVLARVAQGSPSDPQMKADIEALKAHLVDTDATDADQTTAINELVNKLAAAPPAPTV